MKCSGPASRSRGVAWPIISACRAEDPGSNPGAGANLLDLNDIIILISVGLDLSYARKEVSGTDCCNSIAYRIALFPFSLKSLQHRGEPPS